jgi:CarboxypepD_reg-like domain
MSIKLKIPEPCHESWQEMAPVRHDCRHCAACDRQIVDFTHKTDAAILQYLQNNPGKICGRFSAFQLERPMKATVPAKRTGLTAVAASFAAVLAAQHPAGNVPKENVVMTQTEVDERTVLGKTVYFDFLEADTVRQISGQVLDSNGLPLPGAMVMFPNTSIRTVTNAQGEYLLKVDLEWLKRNPLVLQISANDYSDITVPLPDRILQEDLALLPSTTQMEETHTIFMGVMVYEPGIDIDEEKPVLAKKSLWQRWFKKDHK